MNKTNKHSSYWIGTGLFTDDDSYEMDTVSTKSSNLMALASYKRAVGNFVNIVTNDNIKVKFDERGNSYTDGKTVTISAKMDGDDFDSTVGLALHEGSHIKLTDFSTLSDIRSNNYPYPITYDYLSDLEDKHHLTYGGVREYVQPIIKDLINIIEDRRIDYYIYSTSPGYKGYYHAMYDKYFNAKIIDKGLLSSEYRTDDWDSYMFRICNLINENRDLDALPMLRTVWNMIDLNHINRLENTRQVMSLACEIFKVIESSLPKKTNDGSEPDSSNGDGAEGEDNENGGGGNSSTVNGTDTTEGTGDTESKQDSTETDETKGDADGDEIQMGTSTYNPNGAGGDVTNEIADVAVSSGDINLTERQKKMLDNAIEKQKKFQSGDITKKKVSKSEQDKLETLSKAGIEEKIAGSDYVPNHSWASTNKTSVIVVRNFTKALAESSIIDMVSTASWRSDQNQLFVNKGIQIGTMLGKKLKLRSEERSLTTPRMKTGKISGRLLHELGMGNTNIFDQTIINKHTPAVVHISIDASSSMGGDKWKHSQIAVIAIAKAASMTIGLDIVISYRAVQGNSNSNLQPLMLIAYDSRKDKFNKIQQLFKYLNPCGSTPEGLCFETILDDITKNSNGIETYFINFSDGYPGFSNKDIYYSGDAATNHTALQVKKMQKAGVKVLSYFISGGSGESMRTFIKMYGTTSENVDVSNLIPLTKTLNKLFQ